MLKPQLKIEQNGVLTDVGAWFKPSMADEKPSLEDVCNLRPKNCSTWLRKSSLNHVRVPLSADLES